MLEPQSPPEASFWLLSLPLKGGLSSQGLYSSSASVFLLVLGAAGCTEYPVLHLSSFAQHDDFGWGLAMLCRACTLNAQFALCGYQNLLFN